MEWSPTSSPNGTWNGTSNAAALTTLFRRTFNNSRGFVVEYVSPNDTICESWILLPAENLWPAWLRASLYLVALSYLFVGIAIVSDLFMGSIEIITSQQRKVTVFDPERQTTEVRYVLVWNETVANLTLMALGSSAPEIVLAILESLEEISLKTTPQRAGGGLGTFTIVGSAAFNLLVITAICIVSVPSPRTRRIHEYGVFIVTMAWSFFAYIWLLIVVEFVTPGVVSVEEAWITLAFFPALVLVAWAQDRRWWCHKCPIKTAPLRPVTAIPMTRNGLRTSKIVNPFDRAPPASPFPRTSTFSPPSQDDSVGDAGVVAVADDDVQKFQRCSTVVSELRGESTTSSPFQSRRGSCAEGKQESHLMARARIRHAAMRAFLGRSNSERQMSIGGGVRLSLAVDALYAQRALWKMQAGAKKPKQLKAGHFYFSSSTYAVYKSAGSVDVEVVYGPPSRSQRYSDSSALRHENAHHPNVPYFEKSNSTSSDDKDKHNDTPSPNSLLRELDFVSTVAVQFETRNGAAKAGSAYKKKEGTLRFAEGETRHTITIPLTTTSALGSDDDFYVVLKSPSRPAILASPDIVRITIIEDDKPGTFQFSDFQYRADHEDGIVTATILRTNGSDGTVTVQCKTIDGTAIGGALLSDGVHYVDTTEIVEFKDGEASKTVVVHINPKENLHHKTFVFSLSTSDHGALLGEKSAAVAILSAADSDNLIVKNDNVSLFSGEDSWESQFYEALTIEIRHDENGKPMKPSRSECFRHFLTFPWKVLFATIPPRSRLRGWAAFIVSLIYILGCIAVVQQLAELLGCAIGLRQSVTGITIVALGTSLPDLFTSRTAAMQEEHADAAIGNITGSNSVNVFLGLGLPWAISATTRAAKDETYHISRFNITFSVILFTVCAFVALVLLIFRRQVIGGELGGKMWQKRATALLLLFLWIIYIIFSSLRSYELVPNIEF